MPTWLKRAQQVEALLTAKPRLSGDILETRLCAFCNTPIKRGAPRCPECGAPEPNEKKGKTKC
jgi:predicted amidophosphoribosyltransferase